MLYSLEEMFKVVCDGVSKKRYKISGINHLGNRIIVVLDDVEAQDKKKVQVIDVTKKPEESVAVATPVQIEEAIEEVADADAITCRFCGREVTARGKTRHENKCPHNPASKE